MNSRKIICSLMLLGAAIIWGVAFVAQRVGLDYVGPFTFNSLRCLVGSIVLLPVIAVMNRGQKNRQTAPSPQEKKAGRRTLVVGGIVCGLCLFAGTSLQQVALQYSSVGKVGFISTLYIIIVPVIGIFLKRKSSWLIWVSVALAVVGMFFLCVTETVVLSYGDALVLISSFCFSCHILAVDHFSPKVSGVKLSCVQFFVAGIIGAVVMLIFEEPNLDAVLKAWLPLAYAGVLSCGGAYTLQIIGQRYVEPTVASLLLSLESVVSVLAGWAILGQALSLREIFGCALVFCGIILAQLPRDFFSRKKHRL